MLVLDDVTAGYGETVVLREVFVAVPDGAVVALLGPNGAGKTTLLRVASGLVPPRAGRVTLGDADVTSLRPHERQAQGICHIPEGRGIFPNLTVRENLRLFSPRDGESDGLARSLDAFPRLGERLEQIAGTLSGGEQQMLAVARAYVVPPRIVLLDEVSMGLAPKVIDEIFVFLRRLAAEGAALLVVEQYVSKALEIADYVCTLERGRLGFAGEVGEVDERLLVASYLGEELIAE